MKLKEQLSFQLWLVWRYIRSGGRFVGITSVLSFVGMVLGVASLVVTMSAVSGFESTLRKAVIDVAGDVVVYRAGGRLGPVEELMQKIQDASPDVVAYTPFSHIEGVAAAKGKTIGIALQGVEPETVQSVLDLRSRVIRGTFDLSETGDDAHHVLIGKALASRLGLQVGDTARIVIPRPSKDNPNSFSPRLKKVRIAGVLDLGKYEYDLRMVIGSAKLAQQLSGIREIYSGVKIRLKDSSQAEDAALKIASALGYSYLVKDWTEVNKNLFEAIRIERWVIFIVVSFLVITASFNICSSLFVSVLKRYGDLSILKTMGATPGFLIRLFSLQGMLIGVVGSITGMLLGLALGYGLAQTALFEIPGEVYKLDRLPVEARLIDLAAIMGVSFLICFISTLAPALRGAKLHPVDGLRYE